MDFILKKGTELFHSTGEPFNDNDLNVGGFDQVLWTAMESAISQAYIPKAGSSQFTTSEMMWRPSQDPKDVEFQKKYLGWEYEVHNWEQGRAASHTIRKNPLPDRVYSNEWNKNMNALVNKVLSSPPFNYTPQMKDDYDGNHRWKLSMDINRNILPADDFKKGRLFILVPKRDLKLWDMTKGEKIEGDLNDRDYYELDLFRKLEANGYDGVKINDHAQTEELGNFGHYSYGLFRNALKSLEKEIIHDVVHPKDISQTRAHGWQSPEYRKHRNLSESIRSIIRDALNGSRA